MKNNFEKYSITEDEYNRIDKSLNQQRVQVRDIHGSRWIRCRICGKAKNVDECWTYGGIGTINVGECNECVLNFKLKEYTK